MNKIKKVLLQLCNFITSKEKMEFSLQDIKEFTKMHIKEKNKIEGELKFSIIMPSYNQIEFIERSILSVLNQDYTNYELIIIDGGSTDGTVDIIKKYEDYLAYWITEKDKGQSHALNKGFEKATGDIYAWLNSDDLLLPHALKYQHDEYKKNKQAKIVFGDYYNIDKDDNIENKVYSFDFNLNHFVYEGFHLNSQAMSWCKDVHECFGIFDEDLHRTMDYDMIARFGAKEGDKAFKRISIPLACFRQHDAQKTTGMDNTVISEHMKIAKKINFDDKYSSLGKIFRLKYRFRRFFWYTKRKGLNYSIKMILKSLK